MHRDQCRHSYSRISWRTIGRYPFSVQCTPFLCWGFGKQKRKKMFYYYRFLYYLKKHLDLLLKNIYFILFHCQIMVQSIAEGRKIEKFSRNIIFFPLAIQWDEVYFYQSGSFLLQKENRYQWLSVHSFNWHKKARIDTLLWMSLSEMWIIVTFEVWMETSTLFYTRKCATVYLAWHEHFWLFFLPIILFKPGWR